MTRPRDAVERLAVPLLLVLASLLIYGKTVFYPFVLDDRMVIVENEFLRAPASLPSLLVSDYSRGTSFGPGYYRPLMMMSFALQGLLFGWQPQLFHLLNVLLHALTAWAIYAAARAIGCEVAASLAGALLFVVFPPAQEAVGSVVGRCDIFAALFLALGWREQVLWQRRRVSTVRACVLVFAFGLLAMLGKESGAIYPGVIVATAVFFRVAATGADRERPPWERAAGQVAICAASLLAFAVYFALHHTAVGGIGLKREVAVLSSNPVTSLAQPERTCAALYGTGRLLLALLGTAPASVPLRLARTGPFPIAGALDVRVLAPAVVLVLILLAAGLLFRRGRAEGIALAVFLMALLPSSNLVVAGATFVADRFLYLPFAGLALAAAAGWNHASIRGASRPRVRWLGPVLLGALLVGWGGIASGRVTMWRSEEAIAEAWTRIFPWNVMGWDRTGLYALQRGDVPKARACFEKAVSIDPTDAEALGRLGRILAGLRLWPDASETLRRAVELRPDDPEIRAVLSQVLLQTGDKQEALAQARAAYDLRPSLFAAHHALATALFENERYADAARAFRELLADDSGSAPLHHAYVLSLYREGLLAEAEAAARDAARRFPAEPRFDLWCARLDTRLGRRDQAIAALEEAKRKNAPVEAWLSQVEDLGPLRDDPRVRALAAAGASTHTGPAQP